MRKRFGSLLSALIFLISLTSAVQMAAATPIGGKRAAVLSPFTDGVSWGLNAPNHDPAGVSSGYGFSWDLRGGASAAVYPRIVTGDGALTLSITAIGDNPQSTGKYVKIDVNVDGVLVGKVKYIHLTEVPGTLALGAINATTLLGKTAPNTTIGSCVGFACSDYWQVTTASGIHTHVDFSQGCYGSFGNNGSASATTGLVLLSQNYTGLHKDTCDDTELASVASGGSVGGGKSPKQQDVAWFQDSTLWTFAGSNLGVSGSAGYYAGAWNGVGDYDKNNYDDLFLYNASTDTIYWMSSNGTTLGANGIGTVRSGMGGAPDWAAVGDFDGDGYRNDIVWFKNNILYTFERGANGGLVQTGAVSGFHAPTWGGIGDYDHDGKDDLIMYDGATDSLTWMSSNGSAVGANGLGTIRASIGGAPNWAGVGNFTGDGYRDSIAYFRGATLFTFTWPGMVWTGIANFSAPTWGGVSDHDGDGKDDLILYNGSTKSLYWVSSNGTAVGTNGLGFIRGADIGTPTWAGFGRFHF